VLAIAPASPVALEVAPPEPACAGLAVPAELAPLLAALPLTAAAPLGVGLLLPAAVAAPGLGLLVLAVGAAAPLVWLEGVLGPACDAPAEDGWEPALPAVTELGI
jgi:hypothetical protein